MSLYPPSRISYTGFTAGKVLVLSVSKGFNSSGSPQALQVADCFYVHAVEVLL